MFREVTQWCQMLTDKIKENKEMTVTWCDVCGKEMPKKEYGFDIIISSYGRDWDICDDCCAEFNKWCDRRSKQYRKSVKENK